MADQSDSEANEGGQDGQSQGGQPQGGQPQGGQPQGGQPQGGQPAGGQPQGGQPQGGQPQAGQPQGGQPAGGQPQGGQPQGGQPVGGQPQGAPGQYQQGQQAGTAGPTVSDIFNREDTKHEMKVGLAMFAVVGLGIGLNILLVDALGPDGGNSLEGAVAGAAVSSQVGSVAVIAPAMIAPLLSGIVALRVADNLPDLPDQPLWATVGLIGFAGTLVIGILTWLFSTITFDSYLGMGDLFGPWLGAGIGSAIVAVVVLVALDNI